MNENLQLLILASAWVQIMWVWALWKGAGEVQAHYVLGVFHVQRFSCLAPNIMLRKLCHEGPITNSSSATSGCWSNVPLLLDLILFKAWLLFSLCQKQTDWLIEGSTIVWYYCTQNTVDALHNSIWIIYPQDHRRNK
jgi:hypothetical protein